MTERRNQASFVLCGLTRGIARANTAKNRKKQAFRPNHRLPGHAVATLTELPRKAAENGRQERTGRQIRKRFTRDSGRIWRNPCNGPFIFSEPYNLDQLLAQQRR